MLFFRAPNVGKNNTALSITPEIIPTRYLAEIEIKYFRLHFFSTAQRANSNANQKK